MTLKNHPVDCMHLKHLRQPGVLQALNARWLLRCTCRLGMGLGDPEWKGTCETCENYQQCSPRSLSHLFYLWEML
jgi:hypothetical protein